MLNVLIPIGLAEQALGLWSFSGTDPRIFFQTVQSTKQVAILVRHILVCNCGFYQIQSAIFSRSNYA